jgi:hypothetical protein
MHKYQIETCPEYQHLSKNLQFQFLKSSGIRTYKDIGCSQKEQKDAPKWESDVENESACTCWFYPSLLVGTPSIGGIPRDGKNTSGWEACLKKNAWCLCSKCVYAAEDWRRRNAFVCGHVDLYLVLCAK